MGSKNSTSTTTYQPSQEQSDAYKYVTGVATQAASLPYEQYTGSRVAGFTPDQQAAFSNIENAQGIWEPYFNTASQFGGQAGEYAAQGAQSISPTAFSNEELQKYFNPYTQNVIDTTMANVQQQDALAQGDLLGRAISSGASPFGGDRAGLAAAALANQQSLARNQTMAGLQNEGYNNALGAFQQQQGVQLGAQQNDAERALAASQQYGNLAGQFAGFGTSAQNNALSGASALLQAGTQQQQLGQQQLDVDYQNFVNEQQYPRDVANWLVNALNGNQTNLGYTSSTSQPSGNSWSGILGALTSLGSLFSKRGGRAMAGGGNPQPASNDPIWRSNIHTSYGIDIPQLRQYVAFRTPATGGSGWFNPLPQAQQGSSRSVSLPSGLLAAIQAVPKSLQLTSDDESSKAYGGAADETDAVAFDMTPLGPINPVRAAGLPETSSGISLFPHTASSIKVSPRNRQDTTEGTSQADTGTGWDVPTSTPTGGGILGAVVGPDFASSPRSAMMSAGAAMMASRSPFVLQGIGEGLQAGLKTLQEQKAQQAQLDAHPVVDDSGPTVRIYYPSEKKWMDTGVPTTRAQTLALQQQEFELKKQQFEHGYRPATAEERAAYGVDSKTPLVVGPDGKPVTLGPSTVVDMKGEGKFSEVYGGKQAENAATIGPTAEKAGNELQKSALLGKLLDQASTGSLAPTVATVGAWMESMGWDPAVIGIDPNTPPTLQAIGGLTNQMIMGKIGPGGFPANNFSEQDRKFMLTTIPQMTDLPGAIRIKLAVSDRLNKLAIDRANTWDAAQDVASKNGVPIDDAYRNFERDWRERMASANLFGDLAQQAQDVGAVAPNVDDLVKKYAP